MQTRSFLFLQGPISPFSRELGAALAARGHAVRRINLSLGDSLFWNNDRSENFRGRPAEWPAYVAARMRELAVTDLVLLGEQRPQHPVAIAAAGARGVAVTATDFGYLRPDWIILERDGLNALSHYPRERAAILALAEGLPPPDMTRRHPDRFRLQAMWDVVFHLANTLPWPFRHYESFLLHPPLPAYLGTGWRLLRRGTAWRRAEAAAGGHPAGRAGLPLRHADGDRLLDPRLFALSRPRHAPGRGDRQLRRPRARRGPAGGEAAPVGPRAETLGCAGAAPGAGAGGEAAGAGGGRRAARRVDRARGLLTVNSTAGLRALQLGRPVLALGEALYRLPGLTHQAGLDAFWRAPEQPEPELTDAFLRGIAHHLHIRGDFYGLHGRRVAVAEAVARLERGAGPPASPTPSASSP